MAFGPIFGDSHFAYPQYLILAKIYQATKTLENGLYSLEILMSDHPLSYLFAYFLNILIIIIVIYNPLSVAALLLGVEAEMTCSAHPFMASCLYSYQ